MRELKFRAYIKPLKRYATGLDTIQFHKCCDVAGAGIWTVVTVNEGIFEGDDIVIEQYTGIKDINGEEICEGDIVFYTTPHYDMHSFGYDGEEEHRSPIMWDDDNAGFGALDRKTTIVYGPYQDDMEVIGNIHKNQDLLGDTNVTNMEEE